MTFLSPQPSSSQANTFTLKEAYLSCLVFSAKRFHSICLHEILPLLLNHLLEFPYGDDSVLGPPMFKWLEKKNFTEPGWLIQLGTQSFSSPLLCNPPRLSLMKIPAAEEAARWICSTSLPTHWVLSQYLPSVIGYFPVYCQHVYPRRERKKCPIKVANEQGLLSTYWSLRKCSSYGERRKKGVGQ